MLRFSLFTANCRFIYVTLIFFVFIFVICAVNFFVANKDVNVNNSDICLLVHMCVLL